MEFKRDVARDARLVHASMHNLIVPLSIQIGWTAKDLNDHGEWLKKQPEEYIQLVVGKVQELESA